jgi:hypothetical protein
MQPMLGRTRMPEQEKAGNPKVARLGSYVEREPLARRLWCRVFKYGASQIPQNRC